MAQKGYRLASDLLIALGAFFLSNASALVYVLWLTPEIVTFELVLWLILSAFILWMLKNNNLIPVFIEGIKKNKFILPFVLFSGLSIFWSVYWEISLQRWLILLFTILAGGYIGLNYDINKIIELISVFGIYTLLFSALLVFFVPDLGVQNYYTIQGAWQGIYWHKNHMGLITAFANLLFLINIIRCLQIGKGSVFPWVLLYLFSLVFAIKTDSVATYMTMIILHGAVILLLLLLKYGKNLRRSHYLAFFAILILASLILFTNLDLIFGLFNRSTSLTGRVPMWTYLFNTFFSKRPILGYGFNAFWYIEKYRIELKYAAGYPDQIVIADNGFIDMLVNIGILGFALFAVFYIGMWRRSIQHALKATDINGLFPVLLMAYTLIANISWSLMFESEGFFMLIMFCILFSLSANHAVQQEN